MLTKYLLPVLAVVGAVFAVMFVRAGGKPVPASQPVALPASAPYESYVAGSGIIEASTENIEIGTVVSGIVRSIAVRIGDTVKAGAPLFTIDDRELQADLLVKRAAVKSVEAQVAVEEVSRADTQSQLSRLQSLSDSRAVTQDEVDRRKFAVQAASARIDSAKAQIASAEAQVEATKINLERLIVRAPVDGKILQIKIRLGEFAQAGPLSTPLMLLGNVATLHVRTDVDENDAWRLHAGAAATAYIRGNRELSTELKFVRMEPYVVPKKSLTGDSSERVDTRVLQVIYSFDADALPVFVGQQMDVFIEAPALVQPAGARRDR